MTTTRTTAAAGLAAVGTAMLLAGCASTPSPAELDAQALAAIRASFRDQGIAKVDRLKQDLGQAACSSDQPPADEVADRVKAEALASVKWPAGGQFFGNWVDGERIAQSGRGMTWTDPTADPASNGGNCYNCHQIDKKELSYGTIGPSLWNYGKNRGITDVTADTAAPIVHYTWVKLWNSKAYAACSNMPRFGHQNLLSEQQLRHIMSLLLDPRSPVNQ
ncbi:MAG: sulfur oxidation c-type cytochrome SoxX [Pseudomonadota bacterium]|jgi:sulfur-oxidizing protein SoxX